MKSQAILSSDVNKVKENQESILTCSVNLNKIRFVLVTMIVNCSHQKFIVRQCHVVSSGPNQLR